MSFCEAAEASSVQWEETRGTASSFPRQNVSGTDRIMMLKESVALTFC